MGQLVLANDDEVDDTGTTHLSAGVIHQLDPKLQVYGVFSLLRNQSASAYSLGFERTDTAVPAGFGEDPVGIAVGAIFQF